MKNGDTEGFVHALAEVAKAKGVNQVAKDAGVNRESLYKVLKSGAKTRFETIRKLMNAIGVELTVQPIAAFAGGPQSAAAQAPQPAAAKAAAKPAVAKPAAKPAVAKPAAKPAAAKPAAAKPAVAKAAVKPAMPKPAGAKPAVPKPSASGVHSPTAPAEPQAIPANKRMATDSVLELSR
jgi:probable addiction module antidote protein